MHENGGDDNSDDEESDDDHFVRFNKLGTKTKRKETKKELGK